MFNVDTKIDIPPKIHPDCTPLTVSPPTIVFATPEIAVKEFIAIMKVCDLRSHTVWDSECIHS